MSRKNQQYAKLPTDQQIAIASEPGSSRAVGERHGLSKSTIDYWRTKFCRPPMVVKGTSTLAPDGAGNLTWTKTRLAGRDPDDIAHVPDPSKVVSTATLYDQTGAVTQQWIKEVADKAERES